MTEILLAAGAIVVAFLVLGVGAALLLRWRLGCANRVSADVRSPAPLWWLCSPATGARLHRRLRHAVSLIHVRPVRRTAETPALSVESLRGELKVAAVELDQHLVVVARYPAAHRRRMLRLLQRQVCEVERLAMRLSAMSRPTGSDPIGLGPPQRALEELSEQIDVLEAARDELAQIDRANRLSAIARKPLSG